MALPLATLGVAGMSLVTCVQTFALRSSARSEYLLHNLLGTHGRTTMLVSQACGLLLPMLGAVLALLRWRAATQRLLPMVGALAGPLVPVALLPALFDLDFSHTNTLGYLLVLCLFVLTFEPLAWRALSAAAELWRGWAAGRRWPRAPRWAPVAVVLSACAFYAVYVGIFTIMNHRRMATTAFDLGIYDNLMFNALHGRLFTSPVLFGPAGGNYIAGHAEFGMLLFLPFYALRPGAETMLIIQAVVLGFAALPLYLFVSRLTTRWMAVALAVSYLLFAPLHGPNFYDFHWLPLAIFFHFWLYYAIATRRSWLTLVMVLVLYSLREDVAVGLTMLGLFLLLTGVRPRLGLVLAISSAVWFALVRFVIMPLAGTWYFHNLYNELFADSQSSFASVIKTMATNPTYLLGTLFRENKLLFTMHMLVPLALLPARRASFGLLLVSGCFFTVLTTGYGPTVSIAFQYTTHWIPYLFLAAALALVAIGEKPDGWARQRAAILALLIANLSHSFNFGAILQRTNFVGGFRKIEFSMTPSEKLQYAGLKELVAMIPKGASVAATETEVPQVSARLVQYTMRAPLTSPVDYISLSRSRLDNREIARAALADPGYGLLAQRRDELYLFKHGHVAPEATALAKAQLGL